MTQPDPADRREARPAARPRVSSDVDPGGSSSARSLARRVVERRAWPTAPTTTHISPARPATGTGRGQSRGSVSTPTPASVWTAGPRAIDLDATWPTALLRRIVTAFSAPGADVALLEWPAPTDTFRAPAETGEEGSTDTPSGTDCGTGSDGEMDAAIAAIDDLQRRVRVARVPVELVDMGIRSRPFSDEVGDGRGAAPTPVSTAPPTPAAGAACLAERAAATTDLVVTSVAPRSFAGGSASRSADLVALVAAPLLRVGGTLVVLTHCDWTNGELIDPTGVVVAAGQNADLLYLQHIVAVHTPIRDGHFDVRGGVGGKAVDVLPGRGVDGGRGLPVPHRRIHSDVLLFGQTQSSASSREHDWAALQPRDELPADGDQG